MKSLFIVTFLVAFHGFGQVYLLENEECLFSFKTHHGKTLMIAKDKANDYLVYRYGSESEVELTYPQSKNNSWNMFYYSSYYRGGGIENSAMDLNYLYFNIGHYKYVVYDEYHAELNCLFCGIIVINEAKNEKTYINGDRASVKGSLSAHFGWDNPVKEGEELF